MNIINIPKIRPARPPLTNEEINLDGSLFVANLKLWAKDIEIYNLYNDILDYFIGLYKDFSEHPAFEEIQVDFFKYLRSLGELFVTYIGGEFQLWEIQRKHWIGLKLIAVDCTLISPNPDKNIARFVPDFHGIYTMWGSRPENSWVGWYHIIKNLVILENAFLTNAIQDIKKLEYRNNANNEAIAREEKASMLDPTTPWFETKNPISHRNGDEGLKMQNKVIPVSFSSEAVSNRAYENLVNYRNYKFDLKGMAVPYQMKKQEKNVGETNQDIYNTLNIESITLRNLQLFARKANKLWGLNLSFKQTTDLKEMNLEPEGGQQNEI